MNGFNKGGYKIKDNIILINIINNKLFIIISHCCLLLKEGETVLFLFFCIFLSNWLIGIMFAFLEIKEKNLFTSIYLRG